MHKRTQTIMQGGDHCDFRFALKKKGLVGPRELNHAAEPVMGQLTWAGPWLTANWCNHSPRGASLKRPHSESQGAIDED